MEMNMKTISKNNPALNLLVCLGLVTLIGCEPNGSADEQTGMNTGDMTLGNQTPGSDSGPPLMTHPIWALPQSATMMPARC